MSTEATWRPVHGRAVSVAPGSRPSAPAERTHLQVLRQVEDRILDGRLKSGDRLPAEREFAEMLGVSRGSIREALRVLESMGIVNSGAGRGPDSGCIISGTPTPALSHLLKMHLALAHFGLADLVETRVQLEMHAARQAAAQASEADVEHLSRLVQAMGNPDLPAQDFNALDTEFHVAIAEASRNKLLSVLMQSLRDAVQREMALASQTLSDWAPIARQLQLEHLEILQHIRAGDGTGASRLLDAHIRRFYSDVVTPDEA